MQAGHRHQEFLEFLRTIDKAVPARTRRALHRGQLSQYKHPSQGLAGDTTRWHMHFIPTYSSWLNQVERFFSIITDKAIRRGSFRSVKDLVKKIDHFAPLQTKTANHFMWTATADSIIAKLQTLHGV